MPTIDDYVRSLQMFNPSQGPFPNDMQGKILEKLLGQQQMPTNQQVNPAATPPDVNAMYNQQLAPIDPNGNGVPYGNSY